MIEQIRRKPRQFGLLLALLALVAQPGSVVSQAPAGAGLVMFRLIIVSTEDEARQLALQAAQGSDFAALARNESIDPSAANGGLIGPIDPSSLITELRDALQGLEVNTVSPVVRVPTGFAVVQRVPERVDRALGSLEIAAVGADAGVKYTVSVDGFAESNTALNTMTKPDGWNQDPRVICDLRTQAVGNVRSALTRMLGPELATSRAGFGALDVVEAFVALGQIHAYDGAMGQVVQRFEEAYALARAEAPAAAADLEEMLGIAQLHKAGREAGRFHEPGDLCLLSARPGKTPGANADLGKAIEHFSKHLDARPDDLEVRWLLNVAHIFAGTYPDKVPPRWLVPPSAFSSAEDVGRFTDVASQAGVESFSSAGGVVVDDFDGDGELDILTSNFESCGPMHFFRRGPDGRFAETSVRAGLTEQLGGLNLVQADYDNDGCKDVLVLRGGWELAQRKSLLHNNCNGTFTDVTVASGMASPATSTQTAAWADVDNDGFVDLFVGNEDRPSQLFRNRKNGTFEDVAVAAGVAGTAFTKAVSAADYDNDGDVDLYVSNLRSRNLLYRNDGNWRFTEVAEQAGVPGADRGFPAWFFDYDNDGWEDLLASSYYLSVEESARSYLGMPQNARTMKLYRNLGKGSFADVTAEANLAKVYMPMGSNFGDIDNDGFLDIYFGTGSPSYGALVPSVLLRNRGGKSFVDVTESSGTGEWHKGHGVAFADLDRDGDEEIVFKVGGATPGDAHAFRVFENPGHGNDWVSLDLVGSTSNRAAIGARITVRVEDGTGAARTIHRTVNSGGSFGASPLEQHVGLGKNARKVDVEILWPASKTRQRFDNVPKNQAFRIREGVDTYTRLDRRVMPLGGRRAQ